jgi:large subunit ribosomal protein L21
MSYAIFSTGGRQFRAEPGITIKVPLLDAKPGTEVTFDHVLIASDGKQVQSGAPHVKGAKVTAEVVRHGKDKKIRIFRFARRTGYRRHAGHRQDFTEIKIAGVKVG